MKRAPANVSVRAGKLEFLRTNSQGPEWRDLHRTAIALSWPWFLTDVIGVYLGLNVVFASLYMLADGCIAEMPHGSFSSAFFYSVQTLSTVGYGHIYPATFYGNVVTTIEIILGMFFTAVVTGLVFVRFSRPVARLLFSRHLVICPFDGKPCLQMRVANLQRQPMVEAEFRLMFLRNETLSDGEEVRRFYALKLDFDRLVMFPSALTVRHIIDESSPLHGITPALMKACDARFMTSIVCVDTVIPAPVQSQTDYVWSDVLFGRRFVEIYTERENGLLEVDYGRVHDTEPVSE